MGPYKRATAPRRTPPITPAAGAAIDPTPLPEPVALVAAAEALLATDEALDDAALVTDEARELATDSALLTALPADDWAALS
jgi:hypothetical protein